VEPNNVDGFVQAMLEALELSRERDTVDRCRAHAEQFGWDAIGPRFAELLETVARGGPAVAAVRQAL
jgi:glycosyltransferase involved in cell wall biosynthesis